MDANTSNESALNNNDNAVVISGMSGRFPKSRNIAEFKDNLFNKVDMTSLGSPLWKNLNDNVPERYGQTVDIDKFDSTFFSSLLDFKDFMDPQSRMLLEHVYEAILDAGISPLSLRGSNTGVYVGCCFVDCTESALLGRTGKEKAGILRAFQANHVSYVMDFKGPSLVVDSACSSSGYAADFALKALQSGECDQAIVAGTNLILGMTGTMALSSKGVLAQDGYAQTFDEDAHGYCRADAIVALFLQKSKDAKRVYARLICSKKNVDGYKPQGFPFPSKGMQIKLYEDCYKEIGINPNLVDYMEAHSTGTRVGDPEECAGLDQVLCSNRTKPLLIGSVKSNMGHSEGAAGACSIVKSILAFESKKLTPILHFKKFRSGVSAFEEGRMKVVDELQDFDGSLIGVNSFGAGGANVHLLLQAHDKEKVNGGIPTDNLPRMVLWSGRTEEAVNTVFVNLENTQLDAEYIALLQSTQTSTAVLNTYRGYGIFYRYHEDGTTNCLEKSTLNNLEARRPVVWVYTGMGAQWPKMMSDLQKIPIFNASINKCHEILLKKGINLIEILSSPNEKMFTNILHAFVGTAAIQIGLTDVLRALNITPDFIVGHSVGELGCAYADGCNSAEEVILAAYSRGMATLDTEIVHGSMAAVGMGHEELKEILIDGIEIACHNSSGSSTISGPSELVTIFIKKLEEKKIFVKEVNSSNIPYHSSHISQMGPKLLAHLKEIIKNPKQRSSKWISSSVPKDEQQEDHSKFSSAEYHTNNLLSPVLFQEALDMLPKDALTIEIAPSGLLQGILRRALPDGVHFSLTKKNEIENSVNLMKSLGRIFQNGVNMDISKLYPPVEFPVSRGTPMISPLIKWDHSQSFHQFKLDDIDINDTKFIINLRNPNFKFLKGHAIEGKIIFPATGYLFLVHRLAAAHYKKSREEFDVEFEDIKFLNACFINEDKDTILTILLQSGDGRFEIKEGTILMCVGCIRPTTAKLTPFEKPDNSLVSDMSGEEFYKEAGIRGYQYKEKFKSIVSVKADGSEVKVKWENNWIAFLDNLTQMVIIQKDLRTPIVPTGIRRVIFKPREFFEKYEKLQNSTEEVFGTTYYIKDFDMIRCDGMEFRGLGFLPIPKRNHDGNLVLQNYQFIPHNPTPIMSQDDAASFCVKLAFENSYMLNIESVEIDSGEKMGNFSASFSSAIEIFPLIFSKSLYCTDRELMEKPQGVEVKKLSAFNKINRVDFIIKSNCTNDDEFLKKVEEKLNDGGFLVSREANDFEVVHKMPESFILIAKIQLEGERLFVFKFSKDPVTIPSTFIKVSSTGDEKFSWLEKVKESVKTEPIILYSEGESESGILGLVNCIRREPIGNNVKCVFIDDPTAPTFDVENEFYRKQLEKGLAMNVYRNGQWGSYRHLHLKSQIIREINPETRVVAEIPARGDFSSLKWFESPLKFSHKDELITVYYAALNFRDIMLASGRIPLSLIGDTRMEHQQYLGLEFTGMTSNGRRVMGSIPAGALATHVKESEALLVDLPNGWSLEDGASVLVTYGTVFLGLFISSKIEKGNSILIHAGSGGVGLAAIHIAMSMELEVFTTVSTEEKKNYLLELFPKLKPENIGNSRDTSFEDMITKNTSGKGVDFVLNSLADEKLLASVRCLGYGGTFVEIGKSDIFRGNKINLEHFTKDITFLSINADVRKNSQKKSKAMFELLEDAMNKNLIKPLKTTIFNADQLEEAFRFMASGKHIGKVLIKLCDENGLLMKEIVPRVFFNPEHSYILCGGLGGFGMELGDWMIIRGCRKIVLSSSRGVVDGYHEYRFRLWRSYGVDIKISTSNITTVSGCHQLIEEAIELGPVGGIFNLAVKLNDALLDNQTAEKFEQTNAPKGVATKLLDEVSREKCKNLQHFVVFSSISCGYGNMGQSSYGFANSVMERIIENRRRENLPGKAIQFGPIGDVGIFANNYSNKNESASSGISGTLMQSVYSCLEVLDQLLTSEDAIVTSLVVAEKVNSVKSKSKMFDEVFKYLGIKDFSAYPKDTKLADFGIDSLMTVEIMQYGKRELNIHLTPDDVRKLTLAEFAKLGEEKTESDENSK